MAAAQKLLVDIFVATPAIACGELLRDDETVMVLLLLSRRWLVAVEAVNAFPGVRAQLVLMNDGILRSRVAFRALSRGANKLRVRLIRFNFRPGAIYKECSED